MRLFVYEFLSAMGLGAQAPESLRREGWAMLRSVAEDFARAGGIHVTTLVDESCPARPGHECRTQRTPGLEAFRACVAETDATLVIAPEADDLQSRRSRSVIEAGRQLLGSLPEAIWLASDKLALHRHWQIHRVRSPATVPAGEVPPPFTPPWVCKPRHGAGSQATFLVPDARAWPLAFAEGRAEWPDGDRIVQPYVPGLPASVAFLMGPGQCVPLVPAAQELSDDGRFRYHGGRVPLPASLCDRALRLAQAAVAGIEGLQGYVGVDLVLGAAEDGSDDYAIEINPRLTTSYIGLRRLCRDNLARAWLDVLDGHDVRLAWRDGVVAFDADVTVHA